MEMDSTVNTVTVCQWNLLAKKLADDGFVNISPTTTPDEVCTMLRLTLSAKTITQTFVHEGGNGAAGGAEAKTAKKLRLAAVKEEGKLHNLATGEEAAQKAADALSPADARAFLDWRGQYRKVREEVLGATGGTRPYDKAEHCRKCVAKLRGYVQEGGVDVFTFQEMCRRDPDLEDPAARMRSGHYWEFQAAFGAEFTNRPDAEHEAAGDGAGADPNAELELRGAAFHEKLAKYGPHGQAIFWKRSKYCCHEVVTEPFAPQDFGMVAARLSFRAGAVSRRPCNSFWVVTSHFASGKMETHIEERAEQRAALRRFVRRLRERSGCANVLLALDGNSEAAEMDAAPSVFAGLELSNYTALPHFKGVAEKLVSVNKMRGMKTSQPHKIGGFELHNIDHVAVSPAFRFSRFVDPELLRQFTFPAAVITSARQQIERLESGDDQSPSFTEGQGRLLALMLPAGDIPSDHIPIAIQYAFDPCAEKRTLRARCTAAAAAAVALAVVKCSLVSIG
eukprot:g5566.t1